VREVVVELVVVELRSVAGNITNTGDRTNVTELIAELAAE
jgi:hypothetical protein